MISYYQHWQPQIHPSAWLAPSADIMGRVYIGTDSSVWYQSVLRGDVDEIRIGQRSNIQDHCTLHNSEGKPCIIGDDVTVGHGVILHGCEVQNLCLVGMGSIVMDDAVLEEGCLLAAGSLVPERKVLKSGFLYAGSPARERRALTEEEQSFLRHSAEHYVELAHAHRG
ncbi:MAG: gamma carbonic anhydrase family protein [Mariprofundaceae bacterium]|nr:gamma carbonic anhydrase family protein [Mariprofundaceae bacterium]